MVTNAIFLLIILIGDEKAKEIALTLTKSMKEIRESHLIIDQELQGKLEGIIFNKKEELTKLASAVDLLPGMKSEKNIPKVDIAIEARVYDQDKKQAQQQAINELIQSANSMQQKTVAKPRLPK